jgi:predicted nuclease of restriction endonuclease-like (RecB) superfamily
MSKRSQKPVKAAASVPTGYGPLLAELKSRVRAAQVRAALSVNRELIALYWDIGRVILQRQQAEGWGAKVVARLAADLRAEFPEIKGFSARNLDYMLAFAEAWGGDVILQQPVAKLAVGNATSPGQQSPGNDSLTGVGESVRPNVSQPVIPLPGGKLSQPATESPIATGAIVQQVVGESSGSILQQAVALSPAKPPEPVASLPWGHNLVVLTKLKKPAERLWYAQAALRHGWSRAVLTVQIESQAHRRMGKALTNFAQTLPPPQSDLAQQVLKDPYTFDFLTLSAEARERELEQGLTEQIQKFLVELGVGFAFVGRQQHVEVGGEDYYLDLLFYHLKLRCFVVLDLKMEAFKPEFAGKMNFYLTAVDEQMRHANDQPTIGLLLCKEKNRLTVEYALRDMKKPIGVAEWKTRLVESLPKQLRGALPSVEDLEKGLADDKP